MKDHEIREHVNLLRDTAIQYRDAEQLRARIAEIVIDFQKKNDAMTETCIELTQHLEQKRAIKIAQDVSAAGGSFGSESYQAGYQLACDRIEHDLKKLQWVLRDETNALDAALGKEA